ncbi:MAG: helix-turn-helix domain-containing protein [Phycisphaerales bacterium]
MMTTGDIAKRMRVSSETVRTWIVSGELAAIDARRTGAEDAAYRVSPDDFKEFETRRKARTVPSTRVGRRTSSVLGLS